LDRVRQYFSKITSAEDPAKKRTAVDRAAADRFIKHAITQAKNVKPPTGPLIPPSVPNPITNAVPIKVTSKMRERAQYEKDMKDADKAGEEEAALEVWDDGPPDENMDADGVGEVKKTKKAKKTPKGKGKAKAKQIAEQPPVVEEKNPRIGTKRRRPSIDPFAGYGEDIPPVDDPPAETMKNRVDSVNKSIDVPIADVNPNQDTPPTKRSKKVKKKA